MSVRAIREEVKLSKVLGWSVYYGDGHVFRLRDGHSPEDLPSSECQGMVVFTDGDPGIGQASGEVYRELEYGCADAVVEYELPGSTVRFRGSTLEDAAFEKIRAGMDRDFDF